jgi:hypothetical protein
VLNGKLVVNGTIGPVTSFSVAGILSGSGSILGPVDLINSGTTLSNADGPLAIDSVTLEDDTTLAVTLGGGFAPVAITGALTKGADGPHLIALTDAGVISGQTYTLLTFGSNAGFAASDFTVTGIPGTLTLATNALEFIPELPVRGVAVRVATHGARAIFTITNTGSTATGFSLFKSQQVANSYNGPKPSKPARKPTLEITYSLGGSNITKALKAGTAAVTIPAGGTAQVVVKAKSLNKLAFKRTIKALLTTASQADASKSASARATIVLKASK